MIEDVVKELGYLTLGTRLRRLGERLQAQTEIIIEEAEVTTPAAHFPLLAALERLGALSVGELSESIGLSQPGVTRTLGSLERQGLVNSARNDADLRIRTIELTATGRKLVSRSKRLLWPVIEAAVADACAGSAQSLLPALQALETALLRDSLSRRAARLRSETKEPDART